MTPYATFFLQFIWQPYSNATLALLPPICMESSHLWRLRTSLICWEIVEPHHPDRVKRQFGMYQGIPQATSYDHRLHHLGQRGNWSKDWRQEHRQYIEYWGMRVEMIYTSKPVQMCSHDYMTWFRRITIWRVGHLLCRPT